MPKRKMTPEERERERQWRKQSNENLRRLRELVDLGWEEFRQSGRPLRVDPPPRRA